MYTNELIFYTFSEFVERDIRYYDALYESIAAGKIEELENFLKEATI